jgi:hypothetical protein
MEKEQQEQAKREQEERRLTEEASKPIWDRDAAMRTATLSATSNQEEKSPINKKKKKIRSNYLLKYTLFQFEKDPLEKNFFLNRKKEKTNRHAKSGLFLLQITYS